MVKNKKISWVKGFDRIAILVCIPIAIFGAYYCSKKYSESKAVWVYLTKEEQKEFESTYKKENPRANSLDLFFSKHEIFDAPELNGIIAEGKNNLKKQSEKSEIASLILNRAFENKNADPEGGLVNYSFGLETPGTGWLLVPSKTKRYFAGFLGAIAFPIAIFFSIRFSFRTLPRIFKWIRTGFNAK